MNVLSHAVLLFAVFVVTLQHNGNRERDGCPRRPSLNHINFVASLIGVYGSTELRIGNMSMPSNSTLTIKPVTTKLIDWPQGSTLYAEELLNNVVVRRSLYISVEKDYNTIMFYPYNFTSDFTAFNQEFRYSKFNNLLVTQLDYTHKCDRVVKPSTTQSGAFDFVSWPYCSADNENPTIFSAVLTCNQIKVSFTDVSLLASTPEDSRMYFVLNKTKKVALPNYYYDGYRRYTNPCA